MTVDDILDALFLQAKDQVGLSKLRDIVLTDESINCLSFRREGELAIEFVKVKHGRWIVISEYPKKAECSYCGYPVEHELVCWWDYCPNCGTKMDLTE